MKRVIFFSVLFSLFYCFAIATAQGLHIVKLDKDNGLFATPFRIVVNAGDTLQFESVDGDFNIYIPDAVSFLNIKEADLKVRVNSSTNPLSNLFEIRSNLDKNDSEVSYSIYCITTNSWPDAPPRIIVIFQ